MLAKDVIKFSRLLEKICPIIEQEGFEMAEVNEATHLIRDGRGNTIKCMSIKIFPLMEAPKTGEAPPQKS